jgi:Sulfotransferase family
MKIEKPIFILGAQRSGTTWLGKAFEQHPDIASWNEIRHVWIWGNPNKPDDVLLASDLTPKIKQHIEKSFIKYLEKREKTRICDKTPSNCLRIPFIREVFPDAKILLLIRDGRSVISSTQKKLNQPAGVPWKEMNRRLSNIPIWEWHLFLPRLASRFKTIIGKPLDYWGVQPPGWQEWVGKYPSHVVAAKQWAEMLKVAIQEGRKLPPENYLEVYYEKLAAAPQQELEKIIQFAHIDRPDPIVEYLVSTADASRTDKWKESIDPQALNDIRKIMEPMMIQLGYEW